MRKKFVEILLNHYFITIIISGVIGFVSLYLLKDSFTKYKLTLQNQEFISDSFRVFFEDLNNNGLSEKIFCFNAMNKNATFILYDDKNNLVDQWNFTDNTVSTINSYWFLDANNNGFKEIYLVTQKKDSVFLNVLEIFSEKGITNKHKKVFVDTIHGFNSKYYSAPYNFTLSNHKTENCNDVYFTMNTGFGGYPRNLYKYNYYSNELIKSPHLTNISIISAVADIDNDGFDEVFFKNTSNGNTLNESYTKRSDLSLWLNVLTKDLKFEFNPVEFKVPFSELTTLPFKQNGTHKIASLLYSRRKEEAKTKLCVFNNNGSYLFEKKLPKGWHELFLNPQKNGFILYNRANGVLKNLNFDLKELDSTVIDTDSELKPIDIDGNGLNEWISISKSQEKFSIHTPNFSEKHSFEIPDKEFSQVFFGVKKSLLGNQLYIQKRGHAYFFNYTKNKFYYFKYAVFPVSFSIVLSLVFLILKGQKIRIDKKLAIEKEITELQLKTIKNQVDPHFVFNAINTISGLMLTDKKLEADEFICNFSELMRSTLQKSDKVFCTLQEEIDYVKKYIALQQVRFNNQLNYQLKIENSVNLKSQVPKHILYTYIENAIKHGLTNTNNLLIKIGVENKKNALVLRVEDNGGGFNATNNTKINSTGNGLLIMEKIYNLYARLYKKKIVHSIIEIVSENNKIVGVQVEIHITK